MSGSVQQLHKGHLVLNFQMLESTRTLQADLCYVKRCSCVVFCLQAGRKHLTNRPKVLSQSPPPSSCTMLARHEFTIVLNRVGCHLPNVPPPPIQCWPLFLTPAMNHQIVHSLTHSFIHPFIHSSVHLLIHPFIHWSICFSFLFGISSQVYGLVIVPSQNVEAIDNESQCRLLLSSVAMAFTVTTRNGKCFIQIKVFILLPHVESAQLKSAFLYYWTDKLTIQHTWHFIL